MTEQTSAAFDPGGPEGEEPGYGLDEPDTQTRADADDALRVTADAPNITVNVSYPDDRDFFEGKDEDEDVTSPPPQTALVFEPESGAIVFGNRVVGELVNDTLVLDAGWCRLAGLSLRVSGDNTDRRRVVFERPVGDHRLSARA